MSDKILDHINIDLNNDGVEEEYNLNDRRISNEEITKWNNPDIPNDAVLTIKQNGIVIGAFSANASEPVEIEIVSPTDYYVKPVNGIPKTDLESLVQNSLDKADTALQEEVYKGTYSKPSGGIPKSDLSSSVQNSLDKADSALQTEQYTGTYSKPEEGIPKYDLSTDVQDSLGKADTALQAHQDISGKQDLITPTNKLSYNLLSDTPTIPSAVTESTVSGWGFTKNTGTYSKPSGGIPKSDLDSAVQTSLGKADTALQLPSEWSVSSSSVSQNHPKGGNDNDYVSRFGDGELVLENKIRSTGVTKKASLTTNWFMLSNGTDSITNYKPNEIVYNYATTGTTTYTSSTFKFPKIGEKEATLATTEDLQEKLNLSGGNMTGNIGYTGSNATYDMIKFIDNSADTYGNGISIGGGGLTIIGGGESSDVIASQHTSGGDENMVIANDNAIDFFSNCQNGYSSAKHMTMETDGTLTLATSGIVQAGNSKAVTGAIVHTALSAKQKNLDINSRKTATTQTHTGWTNNATDDYIIPTMSFMAFWNGAYSSSGASNLARCNKGAFGNLAVRDTVNKDHISEMYSFVMNGNRYINITVNTNFGAYTRYAAIVYGIAGGALYYSLVRISTGSSATSVECAIKNMGDTISISSASRNSSTGYVTVKLDLGGGRWDHMNVIFMNPNNVTCSISVSN